MLIFPINCQTVLDALSELCPFFLRFSAFGGVITGLEVAGLFSEINQHFFPLERVDCIEDL